MSKNKKQSIANLFARLSASPKKDRYHFTPKTPAETSREEKSPADMSIDEFFARFTGSIKRETRFTRE